MVKLCIRRGQHQPSQLLRAPSDASDEDSSFDEYFETYSQDVFTSTFAEYNVTYNAHFSAHSSFDLTLHHQAHVTPLISDDHNEDDVICSKNIFNCSKWLKLLFFTLLNAFCCAVWFFVFVCNLRSVTFTQ